MLSVFLFVGLATAVHIDSALPEEKGEKWWSGLLRVCGKAKEGSSKNGVSYLYVSTGGWGTHFLTLHSFQLGKLVGKGERSSCFGKVAIACSLLQFGAQGILTPAT